MVIMECLECLNVMSHYHITWGPGVRKIFGPRNENGIWRIKTNQELDEIIKHKKIINFIREQRLSWLGHIERMQGTRMAKAIYCCKHISRRPIGRPKTHWVDDVTKDTQKLKVSNCKTLAQDKRRWKELVEPHKKKGAWGSVVVKALRY
jgi:hypothetical protein